jgi:hypothetical protein
LRALGQVIRNRKRLKLERLRDIHAFAAALAKRRHACGEAVKRAEDGFIEHVLRTLARECDMQVGRFAVGNRIADDGIAVGHEALRYLGRCDYGTDERG